MLKIFHAAGAVAAVLLVASPAAADPFQSFLKACLVSDGEATAAAGAMRDAGWKPLPASAMAEVNEDVEDLVVYLNFDAGSGAAPPETLEILMTGWADGSAVFKTPGIVLDVCGVMSPGSDPAALARQMSAYLGGEPGTTEEGFTAWAFSRQGNRPVPETWLMDASDEDVFAALRERRLYAAYVIEDDGVAGLMLGVLRPMARTPQ